MTGLEQHSERPFQRALADDLRTGRGRRYALANQIDYLLLRAEQEQEIRSQPEVGLVDGGLDEDFFIFTHGFHANGILDDAEFALCARFHRFVRAVQPEPELFILLDAPVEVLAQRMAFFVISVDGAPAGCGGIQFYPMYCSTCSQIGSASSRRTNWLWSTPPPILRSLTPSFTNF